MDVANMNRTRLASALADAGWSVSHDTHAGTLTAWSKGGARLMIDSQGARVETSAYTDTPAAVQTAIARAYALRTVAEVAKRFGLRQTAAPQTTNNGATRVRLTR
jgi:hypothetical protein